MTALDHLARLDAELIPAPWGEGDSLYHQQVASLRNALPAIIEALRAGEAMRDDYDLGSRPEEWDSAMVALSAALGER